MRARGLSKSSLPPLQIYVFYLNTTSSGERDFSQAVQGGCHGVVRKAKPFGMTRRLRRLEPLDPVEEADS